MSTPHSLDFPIAQIKVGDRMRTSYEEKPFADLISSIETYGLIQPILLDADYNLIAGGRRLAAHIKMGRETVKAYIRETLPDSIRDEMEIEENVRREPMTWQDRARGIARIHRRKKVEAGSDDWSVKATGELLGMDASWVGKLLSVVDLMEKGNQKVLLAESLSDAVAILLEEKEKKAQKLLRAKEDAVRKAKAAQLASVTPPPESVGGEPADTEKGKRPKRARLTIALSSYFLHGDSFTPQKGLVLNMGALTIDHVITDIPYGIDMKQVQIKNIDLVEKEHDVEYNVRLFRPFLRESFRVLREGGFCAFFYDVKHHEKLISIAEEVGFRPQAWPLIWCKTGPCKNMSAETNFTKTTEYVMVLRKGSAKLAKKQSRNYLECGPGDTARYDNPFSKPFEVWKWLIEALTHEGQTILDPFAGEMSCPLALIKLDRQPLAIELVEEHYNKGLQHVQAAYISHYNGSVDFV